MKNQVNTFVFQNDDWWKNIKIKEVISHPGFDIQNIFLINKGSLHLLV